MNGYSKISSSSSSSTGTAHKSRSIDFSDFFSFPQTPKPTSSSSSRRNSTGPNNIQAAKPEEEEQEPVNLQVVKRTKAAQQNCSLGRESNEIGGNGNIINGERFGVILGRSSSVSNSSSASTGIQATMKWKRAFSMRRSSSVSERYCRIHDQYMANIGDDFDIDNIDGRDHHVIGGGGGGTTRSVMKKKKKNRGAGGGKILKACKRLLGF